MMRKKIRARIMALLIVLFLCCGLGEYIPANAAQEIIDKGNGITWVDAAVQLPNNYASIIGFKLTFKLLSDQTDYKSGYGGVTEDPSSPEYNMHFPCYLLVASKGAHDNSEFNSETFWCEENENYEHYRDNELAKKEIVKIGVGAGHYVAGYLDNGKAYSACANMVAGDTATVTYQGTKALFEQGDSILTFYNYTAEFEILSIEWITGTPAVEVQENWTPVEKEVLADIETVQNSADQNGSNYLNIIRPKEGEGPFPVILWIHGGAWSTSSRTDIILNETMEYFLSRGYAFVSVEYTLTDKNAPLTEEEKALIEEAETEEERENLKSLYTVKNATQGKQMIYDIKLAVRFLRANAEKYNLDTRFIAAMGESAGAHLALLMGTTNGSEAHEGANGTKYGGWEGYSSDVQAAVCYSLPSDLTTDSITFLEDYKDTYPVINSIPKESIYLSNYYMAYLLLGYDYLEKNTLSGTGGTADAVYSEEAIEAEKFMSPFHQVNADSAPMYIIHGEADAAVLITHSYAMELMAKQLMDAKDVKTAYYPEAGHVDKKFFDTYAQYVSSCDFVTSLAKEAGCFTDKKETGKDDNKSGVDARLIIGITVAVIVIVAVTMSCLVLKRKANKGESNEKKNSDTCD